MTLLLQDYYLIPNNDAKNLLRPRLACMHIKNGFVLYCKMNSLKIEFGLNPASAQVVQVIKVDFISLDIVPIEIDKNLKFNYPNYSSSTLSELPFHRNSRS